MGCADLAASKDIVSIGHQLDHGSIFLRAKRWYVGNELARRTGPVPLSRAPQRLSLCIKAFGRRSPGLISSAGKGAFVRIQVAKQPTLMVDSDSGRRGSECISVQN